MSHGFSVSTSRKCGREWRAIYSTNCGMTESRCRQRQGRTSRSLTRSPALDELAYVFINQCGLLVNDPMRSVWYPLDRQIRNELIEPLEVVGQQGSVLLAPDNERRH